jgi:DNA polymerase-3 subunit epsilon
LAVIDLETTGFDADGRDRVVEVAVILVNREGMIEATFETLVDPLRDPGPSHIHGISAQHLRHAPEFGDIAGYLVDLFQGRVVVSHNLAFDGRFIEAEFRRIGVRIPSFAGLCTMRYARRLVDPPNLRLATVCKECGIAYTRHHTALGDAVAVAQLTGVLWRACPDVRVMREAMTNATARHVKWPSIPTRASPVPRREARPPVRPVLAELLDALPAAPGLNPGRSAEYLELLSRVLEDRQVTDEEIDALQGAALEFGLDRGTLSHLHRRYLVGLARAAWADGRLTRPERDDLVQVATMLAVPVAELEPLLKKRAGSDSESLALEPMTLVEDLRGKTVCFTGQSMLTYRGQPLSRDLAESLAAAAGLVVKSSVSRKLDLLVCADPESASTKLRRARELGVRVMAEIEFWRRIGLPIE